MIDVRELVDALDEVVEVAVLPRPGEGTDHVAEPVTRQSLEELAEERGAKQRDCRACPQLESQGDGLSYGWCRAHAQFIKFYHPAGEFWSQCQFKALARERPRG